MREPMKTWTSGLMVTDWQEDGAEWSFYVVGRFNHYYFTGNTDYLSCYSTTPDREGTADLADGPLTVETWAECLADMFRAECECEDDREPPEGMTARDLLDRSEMFRSAPVRNVIRLLAESMIGSDGGRKLVDFDDAEFFRGKNPVVYHCHNGQGKGEEAICATLDGAKQWLLTSISKTAGDDGKPGGQWAGWVWWTTDDGRHCFGVYTLRTPPVAEGTIREFRIIS